MVAIRNAGSVFKCLQIKNNINKDNMNGRNLLVYTNGGTQNIILDFKSII